MKIAINPPAGALPGKTYVRDSLTGLLLMKDPTLNDVLACRGIYFEYSIGGIPNACFLAGRAFDEYAKLAQQLGAVYAGVTTAAGLAVQLVQKRFKYKLVLAPYNTACNGRVTGGFTMPVTSNVSVSVSAVYAVPHNLLSGYWQTNGANLVNAALLFSNATPPVPISLNGNLNIVAPQTDWLEVYGILHTSRVDAGNDSANAVDGTSGWRGLPTYAALTTLKDTYSSALDKLLNGVTAENSSDAKVALKSMVLAELATRGVAAGAFVVQPLIFGGYADSLRVFGDGYAWAAPAYFEPFSARATTTTAILTDGCNPMIGTLAPISKTQLRMPTMLIGDGNDSASPVFHVRCYQRGFDDPCMKWSEATSALCKTIGGLDSRELLGSQPFGALFNDDRTRKVLPDGNIDIAAVFDKVRSYSRQLTMTDPTPTYLEQSGNTIQQQQAAFFNSARSSNRALSEACSVGETYAVSPRTLISLVNDGLVLSGDNVAASLDVVKMILRCYPLDSNTTATV